MRRVAVTDLPLPGKAAELNFRFFMEHHARVSINAPVWGSVNLRRSTYHPLKLDYSYREGRGGVIFTLIIHWLGPLLFLP